MRVVIMVTIIIRDLCWQLGTQLWSGFSEDEMRRARTVIGSFVEGSGWGSAPATTIR
jgi:hypothetical protein